MQYPGLVGPAYQSASYMADCEELINLYIEKNETPNAPSPYCLLPTPGFAELLVVPEGPIRGEIGAVNGDRKSTRLNSSHAITSRMPSSA